MNNWEIKLKQHIYNGKKNHKILKNKINKNSQDLHIKNKKTTERS